MTAISLMNQSATWYSQTTFDKYGAKVSGTGASIKLRIQKSSKTKVANNGETISILAIAYAKADSGIKMDDRIDYGGVKYRVFGLYEEVDGKGAVNHLKLELIKWQS